MSISSSQPLDYMFHDHDVGRNSSLEGLETFEISLAGTKLEKLDFASSALDTNVSYHCGDMASNQTNVTSHEMNIDQINQLKLINYWTNGIITNTIVILGLIGNILTIVILSQRAMRSSTNYYLSALAVWDSIVLICTGLLIGLQGILANDSYYMTTVFAYVVSYIYPLALVAQTATIWLTVSFTVERYIAVCHPLKAASMCTISRAKIVIAGVSLGSTLYNIPRWFDYRPRVVVQNPNVPSARMIIAGRTLFSQNPVYLQVYFSWLYVPIMCIVPLVVLSVLNTFLILAVRKSQRQRKDMNVKQSRENNVTIMLVTVVIVFIICQVPALVYNIAWAIDNKYVNYVFGYQVLSTMRNFLVNFNSAINFLLYCALGQKFRRIFLHTFFRKCAKDTYIPMSGIHNQTQIVAMAQKRHYIAQRINFGGNVKKKSSMDTTASNLSSVTGGAHSTAQCRSSQESALLNSTEYTAPNYTKAKCYDKESYSAIKDKRKRIRGGTDMLESDDDYNNDVVLEHLLPEKNLPTTMYGQIYKANNIGKMNRSSMAV